MKLRPLACGVEAGVGKVFFLKKKPTNVGRTPKPIQCHLSSFYQDYYGLWDGDSEEALYQEVGLRGLSGFEGLEAMIVDEDDRLMLQRARELK